jgi:hypothetical protein
LANQGQAASNNVTGNLLSSAQQQGQDYQNAAAATASGYVGGANAYGSALNGIGGNLSNLALLSTLSGYGKGGMNSVPTAGMDMYGG